MRLSVFWLVAPGVQAHSIPGNVNVGGGICGRTPVAAAIPDPSDGWSPRCWRYSNAAIAQPIRQILLAPLAIFCRGVEGPKFRIVHHRLVRPNEGILHPQWQRPARRGL